MTNTMLRAAAATTLAALLLAGCGTDDDNTADPDRSGSQEQAVETVAEESGALTVEDPYVKAADSGMTAIFGTLVNNSDTDVTVVSATSEITAAMELHETVADSGGAMSMRPKEGGFTVPAGGEHVLEPGGDHIMVMDLTRPVTAGEDVTLTLTLGDGSTTDVSAAVKDVAGGDEEYMGGMDMGSDMGSDADESTPAP